MWDKFKMAQKYLQRANAIHPEDAGSKSARVEALALQDVYYDCYMSSFSREDLIKRLSAIIDGKIDMPDDEEDLDEPRYREIYIQEARTILASLP